MGVEDANPYPTGTAEHEKWTAGNILETDTEQLVDAIKADELMAEGHIGMQEKARYVVYRYLLELTDEGDTHAAPHGFSATDVYVVWFTKTLQNWKAMVSSTIPGLYFEVTYNGDKDEIYLDAYQRFENVLVKS